MKVKRILLIIVMALMVTCFCPVSMENSFAAVITSNGGTVLTNDTAQIRSAFGGRTAVSVTRSDSTTTITLNSDIKLNAPIIFGQGASGDSVMINLNGFTLTGADGISGSGEDAKEAAEGKNALQIAFKEFDITVNGPGTIAGGSGAVYDNGYKRFGAEGGAAIQLIGTGYDFAPARLEHGLTVKGGAQLIGGKGADGTFDDWEYGMLEYDGSTYLSEFDKVNIATFMCGDGGPGIDQIHSYISAGYVYHNYLAMSERSFAKIIIENGTVSGGRGGDMDFADNSLDALSVEGSEAMMNMSEGKMYGNIYPGDGGPGITYYTGRKYINVGAEGTVTGGNGGSYKFSASNKLKNWITMGYSPYGVKGCGGSGIYAYGDSGITNDDASLTSSNWSSKTANSNDVGIYIKGQVKGGNSQDTDARNASTFRAGHGVEFDSWYNSDQGNGSYSNEQDNSQWGILLIDTGAKVNGGNAGDSVCEDAGDGGEGISITNNDAGYCEGIVVRGTVAGGKGGSTKGNATLKTYPGNGGNGIYGNQEAYGNGTIKSGDGGSALVIDTSWYGEYDKEPSEPVYESNREYFTGTGGTLITGAARTYTKKSSTGLNAKASISEYTNYPDSGTRLTCNATLPAGYSGNVYYEWRMQEYYKDPITGAKNYASVDDDTEFRIKNNESSFTMYEELVKEILSTQHANDYTDIYCYVMLEDGRYIKSSSVTIDPCRIGYKLPQPVIKGEIKELAWDHVTITWEAPEEEDSIDGYTINRGTSRNNSYSDWTLATVKKGEPLEYTDNFVANKEGSRLYYKIRTFDSERSSTDTYIIEVSVPYRPMPPINDLSVSQGGGNVTLNWSEPESEEYTSHNGYRIYRDNVMVHEIEGTSSTSWTDTSVRAGQTYTYYVTSFWPEFDESVAGNKVTVKAATADQKACSHINTSEATVKAGLTADGSKKTICDSCRLELSVETIARIDKITVKDVNYTGNPVTPEIIVTDATGKEISSRNYSVELENNTDIGTAKAVITFNGDYTGTAEKEFKVLCAHSSIKKVNAKAAGCTEAGNSQYWTCDECHEYFSSSSCTEASRIADKDSVIIPAKGHSEQTIEGSAATCSEPGTEEKVICSACGEVLSGGGTIPAAGHIFSDGKCTECGYEITVANTQLDTDVEINGTVADGVSEDAAAIANNVQIDPAEIVAAADLKPVDEIISEMKLKSKDDEEVKVSVDQEVSISVEVQKYDLDSNEITIDIAPVITTKVIASADGKPVGEKVDVCSVGELKKPVNVRVPLPFGETGDHVYITLNMGDEAYLFESVIEEDENGYYTTFTDDIGFSVIDITKTPQQMVFDEESHSFIIGGKKVTGDNVTEELVEMLVPHTCLDDGRKLVMTVVVINGVRYESPVYEVADKAPGQHVPEDFEIEAGYCKNGSRGIKCSVCEEILEEETIAGYSNYYVKGFKLSTGKKYFIAKWTKQTKSNLKKFTGYQVQYSTNADMSSAKTAKVGKSYKSKKISKLSSKKRYYVRVRTYRTVGGITYYSKWSSIKSVKTK